MAAFGASLEAAARYPLVDFAAELDAEMGKLHVRMRMVPHILETQRATDTVVERVDAIGFDGLGGTAALGTFWHEHGSSPVCWTQFAVRRDAPLKKLLVMVKMAAKPRVRHGLCH
ncbi:MAG: hypothetical protein AABZ73_03005 [Pseudomonadota bacterium]|uniref:hypothetical protein n=1 Tax=Sphingobium sp. TaxID=1912891 RepID=UPI002E1CCFEE